MKLFWYEWKKALGSRFLILCLFFCTLFCALLCFFQTQRDESYFALKKIERDFLANEESVRDYYQKTLVPISNDYQRLLRAYLRGEISQEPSRSFPCSYSQDDRYNDYDLIRSFFLLKNQEEAWKSQILKTIERAEISKEDLLIFYRNLDEKTKKSLSEGL